MNIYRKTVDLFYSKTYLPFLILTGLSLGYLPVSRALLTWLKDSGVFVPLGLIGTFVGCSAAAIFLIRQVGLQLRPWLAVVGFLAIQSVFAMQLNQIEERVHLLQYSAIAFGAFYWVKAQGQFLRNFAKTSLLGTLVGICDEWIQYLLPDRYFDWRDIGFNAFAAVLAALLASWLQKEIETLAETRPGLGAAQSLRIGS